MQFIKQDINFDFIGKTRVAAILSCVLIAISAGSLIVQEQAPSQRRVAISDVHAAAVHLFAR